MAENKTGCPYHSYCTELSCAIVDKKISEKEVHLISAFQNMVAACANEQNKDMLERRKEYMDALKEQGESLKKIQIKMGTWAGIFVVLSILAQIICGVLVSVAVEVAIEHSVPKERIKTGFKSPRVNFCDPEYSILPLPESIYCF